MPAVDDYSFFDFSHDITCTEKRYVVACVETYDSTGTYITVKLLKKDNFRDQTQDNRNNCNSEGFKFNQKITLSLAEFEQLSPETNSFNSTQVAGRSKKKAKKSSRSDTQY